MPSLKKLHDQANRDAKPQNERDFVQALLEHKIDALLGIQSFDSFEAYSAFMKRDDQANGKYAGGHDYSVYRFLKRHNTDAKSESLSNSFWALNFLKGLHAQIGLISNVVGYEENNQMNMNPYFNMALLGEVVTTLKGMRKALNDLLYTPSKPVLYTDQDWNKLKQFGAKNALEVSKELRSVLETYVGLSPAEADKLISFAIAKDIADDVLEMDSYGPFIEQCFQSIKAEKLKKIEGDRMQPNTKQPKGPKT